MNSDKQGNLILGGKELIFDAPIKQRLELNGLTIVRVYPDDNNLNSYPQEKLNRNVYAYNSLGQLVWQIQEAPHGGIDEDKAYMDIKIDGDDSLVAGNWIGIEYQVNSGSGEVVPLKRGGRPW